MTGSTDPITTVIINLLTVIPPTIMALAAFQSARRVEKKVGDTPEGQTIADSAISHDSTLRIATAILDRMDERLEAVEKGQVKSNKWHDNHEAWHAAGEPERRGRPRG